MGWDGYDRAIAQRRSAAVLRWESEMELETVLEDRIDEINDEIEQLEHDRAELRGELKSLRYVPETE